MLNSRLDNALQQGTMIKIKSKKGIVGVTIGNYDKDEKMLDTITFSTGENFEEAVERASYSYNVSFNYEKSINEEINLKNVNNKIGIIGYDYEIEQEVSDILYNISEDNRDYYLNGGRDKQCAEDDDYIKNIDMIVGVDCAIDNLLKNGYEIEISKGLQGNEINIRIKNKDTIFQFTAISVYHAFEILKELATDINNKNFKNLNK